MRDPVKLINFTRYLKETKRYELAIQYAEMIDPEFIKNEVLRITTFEALLLLEKYERYIELHDQYLLINPQNATTYNNKGFALKKLFRYQEAIECYDRGLSFNPSSEALLDNKGLALAEMGQYQAALECFNKAIESAPQSKTAFNNKGSVLIKMGRFEEAIQALDQAILNDSTSANEHKHKAFAFHKLGRLSEALAEYEISLKFEPQYIEAEACRALTFFDMKDFENCYESVKNLSYMRQQGYLKGFSQLQVPYLDRCLKKLLEVFTSTDYVSSDNIVCRGFYEVVEILANGNHGADCMKRLDCLVFEMESFDTQMFSSNQIKI